MTHIFVSYSRIDLEFTERIVERLRRVYGLPNVWYDDELHGGTRWWKAILTQIAECDVFVYLLSNESVTSPYCQAEFIEAKRLQKPIVTVQIRDKTRLSDDLSEIQYVDMKRGMNDDSLARLIRAINEQAGLPKKKRALWTPATLLPTIPASEETDAPTRADMETPTLRLERPQASGGNGIPTQIGVGLFVTVVGGLIIAVILGQLANNPDAATAVARNPTATIAFTDTPPTAATDTPLPTLDIGQMVGTMDAQATLDQSTLDVRLTSEARATAYAVGTLSMLDQTATADAWTDTPTQDITASIEAFRIQQTATAEAWTDTPAATMTLSPTYTLIPPTPLPPTATLTPSPPPTFTSLPPTIAPTPAPIFDPLQAVYAQAAAYNPANGNDGWTPVAVAFDGVPMVLVPPGCFMMGSNDFEDEQPIHEQCFDAPFWIDQTEVRQADFARLGGVAASDSFFAGDQRPVEQITWFEARDFCALRGGRMPTEREWEYASRGVDGLIYPWGDTWNENNAVWDRTSTEGTANVGSINAGASWVGALDMSGNVWEWVNTIYGMDDGDYNFNEAGEQQYRYPYNATDGREQDNEDRTFVRVLRGGSWINDVPDLLRAADRLRLNPGLRGNFSGFRCALSS